jgi:EmrB/QacA subfamily drug resistance transporter
MDPIRLSSRRGILILAICCMSILLVSLDVTIVNVALPSLQRDLHASISSAQWTIDAYSLVLASMLLFSGSVADRVGRKKIFMLGLLIFSLGSLLCSLSPNIGLLIFFRMLQGIGGSMLNPVALSIVNNTFTVAGDRARAIGMWAGVVGISTAAGPIVGGALIGSVGWRSIFWINIPIGILALILTRKFIPESKAAVARRHDPVGQILVIGFLSLLLYGIIELPHQHWRSGIVRGCFILSVCFFIGLIRYERQRFQPLIELKFFKSAPFAGATIIAICTFIGNGGFLFLNTLYLQDVLHYTALKAGSYLIPMALAMLIAGPISGRLISLRGTRLPLTLGGTLVTIAAVMFAVAGTGLPTYQLFIGYALIGAGLGLLNAAITNTALSGMPRSEAGVAAATTSTSRQVGQSLGVGIIGSILATGTAKIVAGARFNADWKTCWIIISGVGLLVLITANITTSKWGHNTANKLSLEIEAEDNNTPSVQTA